MFQHSCRMWLLVAVVCMVGYFLIGVFRAVGLASIAWLALPICIIILLAILLIIRAKGTKEAVLIMRIVVECLSFGGELQISGGNE